MSLRAAHPVVLAFGSLLFGLGAASWLAAAPGLPWFWLLATLPTAGLLAAMSHEWLGGALLARCCLVLLGLGSALLWLGLGGAALIGPLLGLGGWLAVLLGDLDGSVAARRGIQLALQLGALALGAALSTWLTAWSGVALEILLTWGLPLALLPWVLLTGAAPRAVRDRMPGQGPAWRVLPVVLLAAPLGLLPVLWAPAEIARVAQLPPGSLLTLQWQSLLLTPALLLCAALAQRWLGARWLLRLALLSSLLALPVLASALRDGAHAGLALFRAEVPVTLVSADCAAQAPCTQVYEHLLALGLDVQRRHAEVDAPWLELDGQAVDLVSLEWVGNALNTFNFPSTPQPGHIALLSALAWLGLLSALVGLPLLSLAAAAPTAAAGLWVGVSVLPVLLQGLARPLALQSGLAGAAVYAWVALALLALLASLLLPARTPPSATAPIPP